VIATLKEQLVCDLKCEKLGKKKLVDHVKVLPQIPKSYGYSSEALSSVNSLPNSEEGLAKPPQET
jgi:hypothetical protein